MKVFYCPMCLEMMEEEHALECFLCEGDMIPAELWEEDEDFDEGEE